MKLALIGPEFEENLGLRYIEASVRTAGHETAIFDFRERAQIPAVAAAVLAWRPDVVGLSMVFTARAGEFLDLACTLRAADYRGHMTAGGHFASFHAALILKEFPALDSVVHGEGEAAAVELLDHLDNLSAVRGLSFRNPDSSTAFTGARPNSPDLDARPWPTRPETSHRYLGCLPIADVLGSRGCYARCRFCSIQAWHRENGGRAFRQRSVDNLADELAWLYHDRGIRIFNFHDDNFLVPRRDMNLDRIHGLRRAMEQRGVGQVGLQIKARPDSLDAEVVNALVALGLFRVFLGVENSSEAGLISLGRNVTQAQNVLALALLRQANVHTSFNLLMFDPDTRLEDLQQNIRFLGRQSHFPLNFCRVEVYAGTDYERRLRAQGRLEGDYFGYHYRIADPAVQRIFEIFSRVFWSRNFSLAGMNHQAMRVDYEYHLLRHFFPERVDRTLERKVKALVARINHDSAARLAKICRFVETGTKADTAESERFADAAYQDREAWDRAMIQQAQALVRDIESRVVRRHRAGVPWATAAASLAASAAIALTAACNRTESTEMAPPPQTQPLPPNNHTYTTEMAPAPQIRPSVPPSTLNSALSPYTSEEQTQISAAVTHSLETSLGMAAMRDPGLRQVRLRLHIDAQGRVVSVDLLEPTNNRPLQRTVQRDLRDLTFENLKKAGTCEVRITEMPQTHMCEMVPMPMDR